MRALRQLVEALSAESTLVPTAPGLTPSHTWWSVSDGAHVGPRAGATSRGRGATPSGAPVAHRSSSASDAELDRVRALVTLAQQGDGEAFATIYESYVDVVYRYVYYRVGSHHVAEDLTSETFVRALRRLDSYTWTGRDIAAWFVTIARNLVVDHVKSSRYRLEVTTGDMLDGDERAPSTETEVLERLRDERLLSALRGLKADQQECLSLRFLQGLSLAETAEVMGRSAGAVKQLQLRAVRSLHRALGGERP
ncbi:MAG TPA: sigma-70 family RNA polymerase sigma factor [Actinomycetales bacterium]|nr:sigma-70 family RNA polymerase sigma factor [Actinomycetales bacterium]